MRFALLALLAFALPSLAGEFRSTAEDGAILYDAPSARAKKLYVVSRLYPVEIMVNVDNWVKVRDQSGELAWMEKKALTEKRTVIVTVPMCEARQNPEERSALVFQAQQGVVLDLVELAADGWVKLRHADGQTGYAKVNQVWGL